MDEDRRSCGRDRRTGGRVHGQSIQKANAYLGGSYLVAQATRQDLTLSVTGTATLKPADSYNVTTLISGEIENAPFELGDLVNKGICCLP